MKRFFTLFTIALSLVFVSHSCKPEPEEEPGSIYGIVTDKATGEPVKTAGVELSPLGIKTVTGSEGQFEFNELEAGEYKLLVTKTGYVELVSNTIVVKSAQTAKGDVQIEKLPAALKVVDDKGEELSELDFGNKYDDVSRMFSIFNDGPELLTYEIVKTASWITSLSVTEGSLEPGVTKPIVVTIDREKLSLGENTTTLHITSNNGSKQLTITVEKLQVLNVVDNDGKEINELDFGSESSELSRTFSILNNGGSKLHYKITKSVDWISNISSTEGDIDGGGTLVVVVTIDRAKLPVGDNSTTIHITTDKGNKQLTVKAKKLPAEMLIVDNDGKEISKLDFSTSSTSLTFYISFKNAYNAINYQITKTSEWIESISNMNGTVEPGFKKPIVVAIDRSIIPLGNNSTMLQITSDYGSKQFEIKCNNGNIVTSDATDITDNSAKLKGSTTNTTYTEKGFYFGEDLNVSTKYIVEGNDYSYQVSELKETRTYYYKAYLIHNNVTYYGEVKEFKTKEDPYAGHEYVDLGLPSGLKWATCNSGANLPEEYGSYLTYNEACAATWGGNWRTPTKDELNELRSNCSWTWTEQNGVKGYKVTGNNGNSIFLPAAGFRDAGSLYGAGSLGYYWSSTPYESNSDGAYCLDFSSSIQDIYASYRSYGRSVRLVAE